MINYDPNGLKSSDYEYPGDREALEIVKKIPVFDKLMAYYVDFSNKSGMHIEVSQNCFRVTEQTHPRIYSLYQTAMDRLNMEKEPKLYIKMDYEYNGYATGVDDPYIVVNSSTVNDFTDGEFLTLIGHELGHIKSGHVLYHNMIRMITGLITTKLGTLAPLINMGTMYALMDWSRKSEHTADRAGMIACGSLDSAVKQLSKMMGRGTCGEYVDFSTESILKQYQDFDMSKDSIIGKIIYVSKTAGMSHPWTVNRIKKLMEWAESGQFEKLISANPAFLPADVS